jgi:hypothetical protein
MLDGVTLGCSVGVGDTVGAMLDGVTLGYLLRI